MVSIHPSQGIFLRDYGYLDRGKMSNSLSKDWGLVEGQTYIIGRKGDVCIDGHIYMVSPTVSRPHAEMKIKNGRIFLRDLNSTNGIHIVDNGSLVSFEEGYVNPNQPIMIGKVSCTIQSLLAIAGVYSSPENNTPDIEETQKIKIPIH
jgi:pSer/pThr/pTyr-binding forkhead associated (FHA) protein